MVIDSFYAEIGNWFFPFKNVINIAAKSYLSQYGVPEKPADLSSHSWLEYSVRPDNEFELIAPEGISTRLIPQVGLL